MGKGGRTSPKIEIQKLLEEVDTYQISRRVNQFPEMAHVKRRASDEYRISWEQKLRRRVKNAEGA